MKNRYINIFNRKIGDGLKAYVIAEAGVNHNGKFEIAKKMIDTAKDIGVDAIKFQTYKTEELVAKSAPKAAYQRKVTIGKSQFEMLSRLELSYSDFSKLFNYCKKRKILFLSTPFDFQSAVFLHKLGVCAFKISSGDLTNLPFLSVIAAYKKPIILSTGMSTLDEVRESVKTIFKTGNRQLILLHCTSSYPANYEDANLKAIDTLKREFKVPVGYSDHTMGIEIGIAAVALGACIIEKHFTLDNTMPGPDHSASLEPKEFKQMIKSIRNIESAIGNGKKIPTESERLIKNVMRKSIVASRNISKGTKLRSDLLSIKRPGTGIQPKYFNLVVNKTAKETISSNEVLTWDLIKN